MSALFDLLEARVAAIDRYVPGRVVTAGALDEPGKLSGNENVFGPSPAVLAAVARVGTRIGRYPNLGIVRLELAERLGVAAESVVLTNGSDELCVFISRLLGGGDVVVMGQPGYRMDEIVSVGAGADVRRVPLRDGVHDVEAMVESAQDARVLWLPNPHNPTGTAVDGAQLRALLDGTPDDCLVVVDEAYREFMDDHIRTDTVALVGEHPNLIVQRTFSKSAALAGLRVGFAVADPRVASVLEAFRPPFNVNQVALAAVLASLSHGEYAAYTVALIREQRTLLQRELDDLGVDYWPSQTNFVTIQSGERTGALHEALAEQGIVVRDGGDLGLPGYVRLSVGAPAQMLIVRQVLRAVFGSGNST